MRARPISRTSRRRASRRSKTMPRATSSTADLLALEVLGGARSGRRLRAAACMSGSPMRWPGCCGRCRSMPRPDADSSRPISRRANGLDRADYRGAARTPALRCRRRDRRGGRAASRGGPGPRATIPRAALPALLPAVIARRSLLRLKRAAIRPVRPGLWRARIRCRAGGLPRRRCSTGSDAGSPALEIRAGGVRPSP